MRENLGPSGVVILGHVVELVEQWQIVVSDDVARHARVAVPIPRPPDVRAALDNPDALDAALAQARRGQQGRESAADKQDLDGIVDRLARRDFARMRIDFVFRKLAREVRRVLRGPVGPVVQSEVAFLGELPLNLVVEFLRPRGPRRKPDRLFLRHIPTLRAWWSLLCFWRRFRLSNCQCQTNPLAIAACHEIGAIFQRAFSALPDQARRAPRAGTPTAGYD